MIERDPSLGPILPAEAAILRSVNNGSQLETIAHTTIDEQELRAVIADGNGTVTEHPDRLAFSGFWEGGYEWTVDLKYPQAK